MEKAITMFKRINKSPIFWSVLVILVATIFFRNNSGEEVIYQIDNEIIGIGSGEDTVFIGLLNIVSVDLTDSVDISDPVSEVIAGAVRNGDYRSDGLGEFSLIAYDSTPQYIVIRHTGGTTVFNCKNTVSTEKAYNELISAVAAAKAQT